jgi:uncharacterized protein (DUF885 family)
MAQAESWGQAGMNRRAFLLTGIAAGAAGCGRPAPLQQSAMDGFLADCTAETLTAEPEVVLRLGFTADQLGAALPEDLTPRSAGAVDQQRAASLRRLAQIRALNRAELSGTDLATYEALEARCSATAAAAGLPYGDFSGLMGFRPYVMDHLAAAFVVVPAAINARLPSLRAEDVQAHVQRLRAVPAALDAEAARARADAASGVTPPLCVIDRALERLADVLAQAPDQTIYFAPLRARLDLPPDSAAPPSATAPDQAARAALAQAFGVVADQILPAYRRAWAALSDLRVRASDDPGVARLPDGATFYSAALALETTTAQGPEEIHQAGLARVKAASAQLDMMLRSQGLADGTPGARIGQLALDPRFAYAAETDWRAGAISETLEHEKRVAPMLSRWFKAPPGETLGVRAMDSGDSEPGYRPASFDKRRAAVIALDLSAPDRFERFDIASFAHREGLPGRHLQSQIAMANAGLPLLRRMLSFSAFSDGWAQYAEQLADEMGLYDGDAMARLGYLRAQTRQAALSVVDTGIHYMRWSGEQARSYLIDAAGQTPQAAQRLLADCAARPGRACAGEIGRAEILALRDQARAALGGAFDSRDFHEIVLAAAPAPLSSLRRVVGAWSARARKSGAG